MRRKLIRAAHATGVATALSLFLGLLPVVPALAAPPAVIDLDDPSFDASESAAVSAACGFEVDASVSGRVAALDLDGARGTVEAINVYEIRIDYTNTVTGATVSLRDTGPDRVYVRDGRVYVAVTGRASSVGVIGLVVLDHETWSVQFEAGREWPFWDTLCSSLR